MTVEEKTAELDCEIAELKEEINKLSKIVNDSYVEGNSLLMELHNVKQSKVKNKKVKIAHIEEQLRFQMIRRDEPQRKMRKLGRLLEEKVRLRNHLGVFEVTELVEEETETKLHVLKA